MRALRAFASCVVLCFAATVAGADEVVLTNGRSFTGTIVKEDDREIVIESRGGKLTFARSQIASVKKAPLAAPDPAPAPSPPPPPKKGGSDGSGAKSAPTTKPDAAKPPKRTPADRLAELCAIRLVPWIEEESTGCDEPDAKAYKVIRADGMTSMRDERPTAPDGIDALYVRNDAMSGQAIELRDGMRRMYWYRLYWHDDTRSWTVVHPDLEAFQKDCALADRLADAACKDENGRIGAAIAEQSIKYALQKDRNSPATKERAELRKACVLATGSDAAGELLAQFHELNVDITFTRRMTEKISFAMKRRDVLRSLLAAVGR